MKFIALMLVISGLSFADALEQLRLNLSIGIESGDGRRVGYEGGFFNEPSVVIDLREAPVDRAALNVEKEWSGTYLATINKRAISFSFEIRLSKTKLTNGELSYYMTLLQDRRLLLVLSAKTLEGFNAVKISGLRGREIRGDGENYSLPLITLE